MKRGSSRRLTLAPISFAVAMIVSLLPRHRLGGVLNGLDDIVVARAAAEVALELMANLVFRRLGVALNELCRRHDHARGAEPALQAVLLPEAFLDGVELAVLGHPFDGPDLGAVGLHRQHGTGLHRLAVEMDGAGAALARVAPHVRAGQPRQLADEVDEQQPRLDFMGVLDAVDGDGDGLAHRAYLLRGLIADRRRPPRLRGVEASRSEPNLSPDGPLCQGRAAG